MRAMPRPLPKMIILKHKLRLGDLKPKTFRSQLTYFLRLPTDPWEGAYDLRRAGLGQRNRRMSNPKERERVSNSWNGSQKGLSPAQSEHNTLCNKRHGLMYRSVPHR